MPCSARHVRCISASFTHLQLMSTTLHPLNFAKIPFMIMLASVAQLECGLPGAALEFGAPEAEKNTYCTVTGS